MNGQNTAKSLTGGRRPLLGIQGPVLSWVDPWAGDASDEIMRTGTGRLIDSQDPAPTPAEFIQLLQDYQADFYVHHVIPTLVGQQSMVADTAAAGIGLVLGNEYGNINGWFAAGRNRYDLPPDVIAAAAAAGNLLGVQYDEPEHLQMNANQYHKEAWLPHFGDCEGMEAAQAVAAIHNEASQLVERIRHDAGTANVSVLAEYVFPVLFHTLARAGFSPSPKILKESFQPLQLGTSLGAALQYQREFWICVDLWGPDIGPWFTRAPGLPGHSAKEFASALRLGYFFSPAGLFVENVDGLARHLGDGEFRATEFGEAWLEFVRDFVPANPVPWSHRDAAPRVALVHAEDSNFGRGDRPFGKRHDTAPERSHTVFQAWHLLSHGQIPAHGSVQHIPGFDDHPRSRLSPVPRSEFPLVGGAPETMGETSMHSLFQPGNSVLAFDENVGAADVSRAELIVAVGSRLPERTLGMLRDQARDGATVAVAEWLAGPHRVNETIGDGRWVVFEDILKDSDVAEAVAPHIGNPDVWTQRFGDKELHIQTKDGDPNDLHFEIRGGHDD